MIDQLTVRDFRCFGGEQTARLAPLTLLVGENSTGKTSFLALVKALRTVAFWNQIPDFRAPPYDLGGFADVVHQPNGRTPRPATFEARFRLPANPPETQPTSFAATFGAMAATPVPIERRISDGEHAITVDQSDPPTASCTVTRAGTTLARLAAVVQLTETSRDLIPIERLALRATEDSAMPEAARAATELCRGFGWNSSPPSSPLGTFATAPVRSGPKRIYEPARPFRDPLGDFVPIYLAQLSRGDDNSRWLAVKARLEAFGKAAGLFDELSIRLFGRDEGDPFQLRVRKSAGRRKGAWRSVIDVGYGVSQVLPLIAELSYAEAPDLFLLQQPEVHLHPSAQAALGTLFCEAAQRRQLLVETHSDHLINRVRLDVRDGKSLKPDDVSLLYFERDGASVTIHSLSFDELGNVNGAPDSYGQFFMDETERSLRL